MDPITVHYSKGRVLLIFVGAMVVLVVSIWILVQPSAKVSVQGAFAAWICISFSIIVGAFAFSRLCKRQADIILRSAQLPSKQSWRTRLLLEK